MAADREVICAKWEQKYFCEVGWTGSISLIRFDKSRWSRRADWRNWSREMDTR
jgi:hypothetical protein